MCCSKQWTNENTACSYSFKSLLFLFLMLHNFHASCAFSMSSGRHSHTEKQHLTRKKLVGVFLNSPENYENLFKKIKNYISPSHSHPCLPCSLQHLSSHSPAAAAGRPPSAPEPPPGAGGPAGQPEARRKPKPRHQGWPAAFHG